MQRFHIDPRPFWSLPADDVGRAEGLAVSPDGTRLALVDSAGNRVLMLAVGAAGGDPPAALLGALEGPRSGLADPHDVAFSPDGQWLVVANRGSAALTFHARRQGSPASFDAVPAFRLDRHRCRLASPSGVRFVPPVGAFVVAANRGRGALTFYRRGRWRRSRFVPRPAFELAGPQARLAEPNGCTLSADGAWLAVANHGADTVTLYARAMGATAYGPAPRAEIGGTAARLHAPHSLAFSPSGEHLAVSNAGGRCVTVFRREHHGTPGAEVWEASPVLELEACVAEAFEGSRALRSGSGGSKGLAFGPGWLAVCGPGLGLRLHRVGAAAVTLAAPAGRPPA